MSAPSLSCEALHFWRLSRAHVAACIGLGADSPAATALREEMEGIALHSEWPLLQQRVEAVLSGIEEQRARA